MKCSTEGLTLVFGKVDKSKIVKDLQLKQADYYSRNYSDETKRNYLRRLRRDLITKNIDMGKKYNCILDIGCGPVILFPKLLRNSTNYYAVDLVKANLDKIRVDNNDKSIECMLGDLDHFNWEDNYFDIIICSGMIEYTHRPEDNLLRLINFLKDDGILVCSFPNVKSPYRLWSEYLYRYFAYIKHILSKDDTVFYKRKLFLPKSLLKILGNYDYHSTSIQYFGYKFIPQPFDYLFADFDYKIMKYGQKYPVRWLQKYCAEFILIVRK